MDKLTAPTTVSAMHTVLFNDDLLQLVLDHCDCTTIAVLRLSNRYLEKEVSPRLFRTLLLSTRKRDMRRLNRVAQNDKFAVGVREIIWQSAHYSENEVLYTEAEVLMLSSTTCAREEDAQVLASSPAFRKTVARLKQLGRDKDELWEPADLHKSLAKAYLRFPVLEHVTITTWHAGDDPKNNRFLDLARLLSNTHAMPPPFRALQG